jgi:hypothetical protein
LACPQEDATLLAALALGAPDLPATGVVAAAAAATRLPDAMDAPLLLKASLPREDWAALRSFNPCAEGVFSATEKRFEGVINAAGEGFAALRQVERRRRAEAEAASGAADKVAALAALEAGKG